MSGASTTSESFEKVTHHWPSGKWQHDQRNAISSLECRGGGGKMWPYGVTMTGVLEKGK